jgi:hypothetical protein
MLASLLSFSVSLSASLEVLIFGAMNKLMKFITLYTPFFTCNFYMFVGVEIHTAVRMKSSVLDIMPCIR